jgi:hypothetical protein
MSLPLPVGSLLRAFFRNAAISPAEDVSCRELAFPVGFSFPFVMHQYLETTAADARWDIDARNEFVSIGENLQVTDFVRPGRIHCILASVLRRPFSPIGNLSIAIKARISCLAAI